MAGTKISFFAFLFALILLFASCSSYQRVLKGDNLSLKYEKAEEYFNKEDFKRALPLLEDLTTYYRGSKEGENIFYWLSYTYYKMGQHRLAAFSFKNFIVAYPLSKRAEEAAYLSAYNLYLASPRKDLDQENTKEAINEFLLFTKKYPSSDKIEEVNKYIDELSAKIEDKDTENALLYYKIQDYRASVSSIKNLLEQYPAHDRREELEFYLVRSAYLLAINSIEKKKDERFSSALQYYYDFVERYPASRYLGEVKEMEQDIQSFL